MIEYTCPQCNRTSQLTNVRKRVFCSCGGVALNPAWDMPHQDAATVQSHGPGDAMAELMRDLGVEEKSECSCSSIKHAMNKLGIDGCEQKRDWVISKLRENASRYSWQEVIAIAASNVINPLAISLAVKGDLFSAMLDRAIAIAKARASE